MMSTLIQTLLRFFLLIWITLTLIFLGLFQLKGNPALSFQDPRITPQMRHALEAQFGLDKAPLVQYGLYLKNMTMGNFGFSFLYRQPAQKLVRKAALQSLWLGALGMGMGVLLTLALLAGIFRAGNKWVKKTCLGITSVFLTFPTFLTGLVLLYVFGLYFNVFPVFGSEPLFTSHESTIIMIWQKFRHAFLPALCLSLSLSARFVTYLQPELEALSQVPFVLAARGRGVPASKIFWKHQLLSLLPEMVQILGLYFPVLISGALVLEFIFGWNGMGTLVFDSVAGKDYPVLMAASFILVTISMAGYQLAEWARTLLIRRKHNILSKGAV